jgi:phenylpropionate dioxygenase-like ring-hydroxylating dioxygenase large terminal subunit
MTVCVEASGNSKRFTCPFHGWAFSNAGKLLGVPLPRGYGDDFDNESRGLMAIPMVASHMGFIFATFNPAMPPLADWLGPAAEFIEYFVNRGPFQGIRLEGGATRWEYPGNWKLLWTNDADGYHVSWTHRSLTTMTTERHGDQRTLTHFEGDADDSGMYVKYLGNGHKLIDQRPQMGSRWGRQRPVPGRESEAERLSEKLGSDADEWLEAAAYGGINLSIFPNLLIALNDVTVNEPVAVDRSIVSRYVCVPAGSQPEIDRLRLRIGEDMPTFGSPDDVEMFARQQRGLSENPEVEWLDFPRGKHREHVDDDGLATSAVTDDTANRLAFEEWKKIMAGLSAPIPK